MAHRLREAMRTGDLAPFGGEGSIVECDETFIGRDYSKKPKGTRKGRGYSHKFKVLSLVDRTTGKARSFKVDAVDGKIGHVRQRVDGRIQSRIRAGDQSRHCVIGRQFGLDDFVFAIAFEPECNSALRR